ncbi:DUF3943 domain-containing protein [Bacteroides neonati]|uniref:DUF3943 domain-containing protein n=1 Tax=Bacteroides neonati TaxID=1347393 RepID=UPI0004BB0FAB|nr:DUF3943 domain-containing protein [Bacteroides neonati]
MKTILLTALFYLLCGYPLSVSAQVAEADSIVRLPRSVSFLKKTGCSLAGVVGVNLAVWGIDRFIWRSDFSKINANTMQTNLHSGFVWDNDLFGTNTFLHPCHGALYYQMARVNGFGFYESVPFTCAGSLMWEYIMENEQPSLNDLISTTVGGAAIGEVAWRLYHRLFNRSDRCRDNTPVTANFSLGCQLLKPETNSHYTPYMQLGAQLTYNPTRTECEKPYDWFELDARLNIGSNRIYINRFHLIALLWHQMLKETDTKVLDWGVYQHFDYLDSPGKVYRQTPYRMAQVAALGAGVQYDRKWEDDTRMQGKFFLTAVGLGASASDYYWVVNRDYSFGSGFSTRLDWSVANERNGLRVQSTLDYYQLYTWKGYAPDRNLYEENLTKLDVQGDKGSVSFIEWETALGYQSKSGWNLYLVPAYIRRSNRYKARPDVDYSTYELTLKVGYHFQLPEK